MSGSRRVRRLLAALVVALVGAQSTPASADDVSSVAGGQGVALGLGLNCDHVPINGGVQQSCSNARVWVRADRSVGTDLPGFAGTGFGGIATADPELLHDGAVGTYVFVRGADGALWYRQRLGAGVLGPWTSLGGMLTSGPAAVFTSKGYPVVFVRGADNGLWVRQRLTPSTWSAWSTYGGILTADPDAARNDVSIGYDVVVRGAEGAVWLLRESGSGAAWQSLGGYTSAGPAISYDLRSTHVVVRGRDQAAWIIDDTAGSWSGWSSLGGVLASGPEVQALDMDAAGWDVPGGNPANDGHGASPYRYQKSIWARGTDGAVYELQWPTDRVDGWGTWTRRFTT